MKSFTCIYLLLVAFAATSFAAKCTVGVGKKVISPGQSIKHPDPDVPCVVVTCLEDGSIEYLSCPLPALAAGCTDEGYENPNLPYPECCKRVINCV